ncbi:Hypothetical protein LBF_1198 [Leptospira biflexa serovar Patoc strain 'Patoc 1 (Ames)']|uniref:Uncharacterized protein n=1 Tax=Leptospira biflexa serovar Patoc (strain Patoc 1 / ATCC 23582 / Paris) TaxID=456481 RepID=B0SNT0_LEPBP|nr:hypothetical protein [Leptospira biflexa]ABZ93722.1 Hypothetical protein LBF_1198 [Leptospira biflexa serovar Patoc strain 'Patoc 1 (Ames)']ABZ97361.1 Hypothetical protein LEPBI_I1249 [Leptospira biflexa serovar Patoc strain 'Patoc 1 (Paris)']
MTDSLGNGIPYSDWVCGLKFQIHLVPKSILLICFSFGIQACQSPELGNACDPGSESFRSFYLARILFDDDREVCGSVAPNKSICDMDPLSIIQPRRWKYVSAEMRKQAAFGTDPMSFETIVQPNAGAAKWLGGVLTDQEKIYSIPYNRSDILTIDPSENSFSNFESGASGAALWEGAVLAPNGKIYAIPRDSS